MFSRRQHSILESVGANEVVFTTFLGGFYFNRPLQFQFADEDQQFLNCLHANGSICHKRLSEFEFEVHFAQAGKPTGKDEEREPARVGKARHPRSRDAT